MDFKRVFIRILDTMSEQMRNAVTEAMKHGLVVEWVREDKDRELIEVFLW